MTTDANGGKVKLSVGTAKDFEAIKKNIASTPFSPFVTILLYILGTLGICSCIALIAYALLADENEAEAPSSGG